jgi:hypothetical protein
MNFFAWIWRVIAGERCVSHGRYFSDFCPICTRIKFLTKEVSR